MTQHSGNGNWNTGGLESQGLSVYELPATLTTWGQHSSSAGSIFFFPLCAGKSSQNQDKQQQEQQKGNFSSVPLKSIWISSFQFYLLQETMATRLKDSYSQSDPRESLQIGFSLVVGFHLFIRIWAPPHLWNKCFVWCAGFNKLNIWPAHAHTHTFTHTHTETEKHTLTNSLPPPAPVGTGWL